ncbi:MAG: O-antigen ligase family protein [Candidatus Berkelbacteria bacterium]|nr:O-antigen ligase family protein [Candidatus Berkelbacteria bacterium]
MVTYLIYVCLFLIPAYIFRFSVFGIPTNFFEIAVIITALVFIIERLVSSRRSFPLAGGNDDKKFIVGFWPAYILLLAAIIGTTIAADKTLALGILKGWFFIPAFLYLGIINSFDKKNIRRITIPLFITLILVSLWAILQKLGVISTLFYQVGDAGFTDYLNRFRAFGPFESPNYLAMFVVPMMFITLPIIGYFRSTTDKILILSFYTLPLFALYASHSLGGLLAFGFGIISLFAVLLAKTYRAHLVNSGVKVTALAVGLVVVAVAFAFIFSSIGTETYSNTVRIDIYRYSTELIQLHPIFGVGLGEFQKSVGQISISNLGFQTYGLSYALHPHNLFLAFWLNLGLLGFLTFLYLLGSFFWRLGRRSGDILIIASTFAAMVAILIHGLVDTTYFKNDLSAIFWLLLAMAVILGVKNGTNSQ